MSIIWNERLKHLCRAHEAQMDVLGEKLLRLRKSLGAEADTSRKFQLEQQVKEAEADITDIAQQMEDLGCNAELRRSEQVPSEVPPNEYRLAPKVIRGFQVKILCQLDRLEQIHSDFIVLRQDILVWGKDRALASQDSDTTRKVSSSLKPDEIKTLKSRIQSMISQVKELKFKIVFVGAGKTGTSMIINAIVGSNLLPGRNIAMAILPTIVTHAPNQDVPSVTLPNQTNQMIEEIREELARRTFQIHEISDEALQVVYQKGAISRYYEGESEVNKALVIINDIVRLYLELGLNNPANAFKTIDEFPHVEIEFTSLQDIDWISMGQLSLIDSPSLSGVKSQTDLREAMIKLLNVVPAVVHVLDYTGLKTKAETALRGSIQQVQELAGTNLFVLLNKFDQATSDSLSKEKAIDYVCTEVYPKREVNRKLVAAIPPDRVYPISAKQAFYASFARRSLLKSEGLLHEDWIEDWGSLAYGTTWKKNRQNSKEAHLEACDDLYRDSNLKAPLEQVVIHSFRRIIPLCLRTALESAQEITKSLTKSLELIKASIRDRKVIETDTSTQKQILEIGTRIQTLYEESDKLLKEIGDDLKNLKCFV